MTAVIWHRLNPYKDFLFCSTSSYNQKFTEQKNFPLIRSIYIIITVISYDCDRLITLKRKKN